MKRNIPITWIMAICLTLSAFAMPALAKSINELQTERQQLQQKQKETKALIEQAAQEEYQLMQELKVIDVSLRETEEELERINADLAATQEELEKTEEELAAAHVAKEAKYESFKKRVKFLYEDGSIGYFQVLLEAEGLGDLFSRAQYVYDIIQHDNALVEEMEEQERIIAENLALIERQKNEIEVLKQAEEKTKYALEEVREQKNQSVMTIQENKEKYEQQLDEMDKADKEIQKAITQMAASSAASTGSGNYNGVLLWPTEYQVVTSGYGTRPSPISGKTEFHTGVDIRARMSTKIFAAESGTVIQSAYSNGYGYTVIIDHGNGLSTLYAHNSQLNVSKGQYVERGQVIALAGSTGYSTGPHCHFEVRINGKHVNPKPYLGY